MTPDAMTLTSTIHGDGTLHLDAPTGLPPGRVTVTISPTGLGDPAEALAVLDRIHERRRAAGWVGRTDAEIDAAIAEARAEDTGLYDELLEIR